VNPREPSTAGEHASAEQSGSIVSGPMFLAAGLGESADPSQLPAPLEDFVDPLPDAFVIDRNATIRRTNRLP